MYGIVTIFEGCGVDSRDLLCRKMVYGQESLVMTPGHYIYLKRLGMNSALSRNRYARYSLGLLHMIELTFTVLGNQAESLRYSAYPTCLVALILN